MDSLSNQVDVISKFPIEFDSMIGEYSKFIYSLANLYSNSPILNGILSKFNFEFGLDRAQNSSNIVSSDPKVNVHLVWQSKFVFCLLSNYILGSIHCSPLDENKPMEYGQIEQFIKEFWLLFLNSIRLLTTKQTISNRPSFIDIHPNLIHLACFLVGQSPGLSTKKHLLIKLFQLFDNSQSQFSLVNVRMLIVLRYLLYYFYIPATHLIGQLKPQMIIKSTMMNSIQDQSDLTRNDEDLIEFIDSTEYESISNVNNHSSQLESTYFSIIDLNKSKFYIVKQCEIVKKLIYLIRPTYRPVFNHNYQNYVCFYDLLVPFTDLGSIQTMVQGDLSANECIPSIDALVGYFMITIDNELKNIIKIVFVCNLVYFNG